MFFTVKIAFGSLLGELQPEPPARCTGRTSAAASEGRSLGMGHEEQIPRNWEHIPRVSLDRVLMNISSYFVDESNT
jgi:hypothetical protein